MWESEFFGTTFYMHIFILLSTSVLEFLMCGIWSNLIYNVKLDFETEVTFSLKFCFCSRKVCRWIKLKNDKIEYLNHERLKICTIPHTSSGKWKIKGFLTEMDQVLQTRKLYKRIKGFAEHSFKKSSFRTSNLW